jgi:hypothetical protein
VESSLRKAKQGKTANTKDPTGESNYAKVSQPQSKKGKVKKLARDKGFGLVLHGAAWGLGQDKEARRKQKVNTTER